jgi:PAS domain-containing protein
MNDEFKATLDALLEGDSDGSDPLHGVSSGISLQSPVNRTKPRTNFAQETETTSSKEQLFPSKDQFPNASSLPAMLPEFIYNHRYGSATQSGNMQVGEIAKRMGFAQGAASASEEGKTGRASAAKKRTGAAMVQSSTSLEKISSAAISEDEGDRKKRRIDRNMREKERSKQIASQISALHEILEEASVEHKSDKFSTLVSVERYINELHRRTTCLDSEHKSLLKTLVSTSQAMQGGYIPAASNGMESQVVTPYAVTEQGSEKTGNAFVAGTEFELVFDQCSVACCVANVDGRFLKVNPKFVHHTGYSSEQLLAPLPKSGQEQQQSVEQRNMSIFNIVRREDMESMFEAMSEMLRRPMKSHSQPFCENEDTWTDIVEFSKREGRSVSLEMLGQPKCWLIHGSNRCTMQNRFG